MKRAGLLLLLCFFSIHLKAQINTEIFEFEFEGVKLHGVLNTPENSIPKGIVLIVHGSGQTNAVEQEWHLDVREQLVKSGYATYMWDKMGCGKSGGTFDYNQTVQSSASEVIAAIKKLKREQIPGSEEIGLWGISRAGWINPLVINQYDGIKFWISVSGVDEKENFKYLLTQNLRINGHSEDTVTLLTNEWQEGVDITHSGGSFESAMSATPNLRKNNFMVRFNGEGFSEEGYYNYQKQFMQQKLDEESGLPIYIDGFDILLSNVHVPVLALFGEKDMNVDWKKTKKLYENTLGQHTDLTVRSFPGCNHNLFKANTGGFYEFEDNDLPWDRCDGFLEIMTDWLINQE
ncbi:MAG: hypothetical protein BalsKO_24240 [Balneolaceae bacterium]